MVVVDRAINELTTKKSKEQRNATSDVWQATDDQAGRRRRRQIPFFPFSSQRSEAPVPAGSSGSSALDSSKTSSKFPTIWHKSVFPFPNHSFHVIPRVPLGRLSAGLSPDLNSTAEQRTAQPVTGCQAKSGPPKAECLVPVRHCFNDRTAAGMVLS